MKKILVGSLAVLTVLTFHTHAADQEKNLEEITRSSATLQPILDESIIDISSLQEDKFFTDNKREDWSLQKECQLPKFSLETYFSKKSIQTAKYCANMAYVFGRIIFTIAYLQHISSQNGV